LLAENMVHAGDTEINVGVIISAEVQAEPFVAVVMEINLVTINFGSINPFKCLVRTIVALSKSLQ